MSCIQTNHWLHWLIDLHSRRFLHSWTPWKCYEPMNCLKMVEVVELEDQYDYRPYYLNCNLQVIFYLFLLNFRICNSIINGCMGCYRFIVSLDSHVNCLFIIIYKFPSQKKKKKKISLIVFWHRKCFAYKTPLQQTIQI